MCSADTDTFLGTGERSVSHQVARRARDSVAHRCRRTASAFGHAVCVGLRQPHVRDQCRRWQRCAVRVEQVGRIDLVTSGSTQGGQTFLDLTDRISSGGERGLLGLAFDPKFASNGRFFVDYTDLQGNTVVSQFTRGADGKVDASPENVLLTVAQPFPNHNGGMLAFGADDDLYIGLGDGGSEGDPNGNGQNLDTLLAKILRIDVSSGTAHTIPADNPFASGQAAGGPAKPEIWDYGVRNPWRFSFDRLRQRPPSGEAGLRGRYLSGFAT